MSRRKSDAIVSAYFEMVSGALLERNPSVFKQLIYGYPGIYALYKGDRLYYVGLASNLRNRVKNHLKDRHARRWDRFSVYLTTIPEHIKPLESLILRIANPTGNSVRGQLPRAANMSALMIRLIKDEDADALARLMGGNVARRRRRSKTKRAKGSLPLGQTIDRRLQLRAEYKGETYRATLRKDGQISYGGMLYDSPTAAAKRVVGRVVSGWKFWKYRNSRREWVEIGELRK